MVRVLKLFSAVIAVTLSLGLSTTGYSASATPVSVLGDNNNKYDKHPNAGDYHKKDKHNSDCIFPIKDDKHHKKDNKLSSRGDHNKKDDKYPSHGDYNKKHGKYLRGDGKH